MPLGFLKRRGDAPAPRGRAPAAAPPEPIPEEATPQDHQLRINLAAKSSEGVRMQGGPQLLGGLASIIATIAESDIEVVPPRETSLTSASPNIVHADEATEWLSAHRGNSPITRHALYVLESLDAIDPAFDTFACALLDGEVDTSGYPEYSAIVGGVAAHWDESTGDLILRAVVGWGGRGTRGDTDRTAGRLLTRIFRNILDSGTALGLANVERPQPGPTSVVCPHCSYPGVHQRAMYCPKCGMRMHG